MPRVLSRIAADAPLPQLDVFRLANRKLAGKRPARVVSFIPREEQVASRDDGCLLPPQFAVNSPRSAVRFVLACRTFNEANKRVQDMPDERYVRRFILLWWKAMKEGRPLIMEKCRRMVITWICCALDLWVAMMSRSNIAIVGVKYEKATGFVWRLKFIYEDLQARRPEWQLPKLEVIREKGSRKIREMTLANESNVVAWNQDPESMRSDGCSVVHMEELSTCRDPEATFAQAKIICEGEAGEVGGFPYAINNAWPGHGWKRLKQLNAA